MATAFVKLAYTQLSIIPSSLISLYLEFMLGILSVGKVRLETKEDMEKGEREDLRKETNRLNYKRKYKDKERTQEYKL